MQYVVKFAVKWLRIILRRESIAERVKRKKIMFERIVFTLLFLIIISEIIRLF